MRLPHSLSLLIALATAAFFQPLHAQTAPSPDEIQNDDTFVLPTFTVESEVVDRYRAADAVSAMRIRTQLIETPGSISVLTGDFLNDVKPVRLLDATRYVAGVQDGPNSLFLDRQVIRGFISDGRTVDNFRDAAPHNFEEALVERVEVSKGPNAILAPGANPGGSLNIVTKSPQFKRSHSITALFGSYDAQKVTVDFTDKIDAAGKFAYRLIGTYQDSERYWTSDNKIKRKLIAPQFAWRINEKTDFTLKYHFFDINVGREPGLVMDPSITQRGQHPVIAPEFSLRSQNGVPKWSHLQYDAENVTTQLSTSFNEHITMRLAGWFQRHTEGSEQGLLNSPAMTTRYNPYTGTVTPNQTWALLDNTLPHDEMLNPYVATNAPFYDPTNLTRRAERIARNKTDHYAIQNDWVFTFEAPYAKFQSVVGWAYSHAETDDLRFAGTVPAYNLINPSLTPDDTPVYNTTPVRDRENEAISSQYYINQRVTFWEDRIAVTGGILRYETETSTLDRTSILPPNKLDEGKDMYMGSALVRLTPASSIYYSYSTNAAPAVINQVVLWREGKQKEYGAKMEFFNRRLAFNVAYFEITQSNTSMWNPAYTSGDLTAPEFLVTSYNNHGSEFELTGAVTRNVSVMASYSQVKMRDPLGRHAISVSDNLFSALVNYRFDRGPLEGLNLNVSAIYTGERAGDPTPVDYTPLGVVTQIGVFLPSYTVWNAGASYSWSRYDLRLSVDNLTDDKDFVISASGRNSFAGVRTATGQNIRFAATVKW